MTVSRAIDLPLARLAALAIALLLLHYGLWAIAAPDLLARLALLGLVGAFGWFLARPARSGAWPMRLVLAGLLFVALGSPTRSPDARSIWMFHAHRIALEGDLHAQLDGYAAWSHLDYPVLIPALSASLARAAGVWNEIFPKSATVLSLLPPLAAIAAAIPGLRLQLAFSLLLLMIGGRLLVNGYMDAVLAAYFVAAASAGHGFVRAASPSERRVLGVLWCGLLAALPLVKNEGLVLHGILCACLLYAQRSGKIDRAFCLLAVLSLAPVAAWRLELVAHGISNDLVGAGLVSRIVDRLLSWRADLQVLWGLAFQLRVIGPCALFGWAWHRTRDRDFLRLTLHACALYALALALVYLSTPHDLAWHLATSAERTVLPIALALVFVALHSFGDAPDQPR